MAIAHLPREPQRGEQPNSVTIIQIIRFLRALADVVETLRRPPPGRKGATAEPGPLQVVDASTAEAFRVRVTFGMLKTEVPEIGGVALDADPAEPPTITVSESGYIILAANTDEDGELEESGAVINFAAEIPEDTEDRGHIVLASVSITGSAPNQVFTILPAVTTSLWHKKCGAEVHDFWSV